MKRILNIFLFLASLMVTVGASAQAFAQEADEQEDILSTEGIFNRMPSAYQVKNIVRSGEIRSSEFFYSTQITGNNSATALVTDKSSHAGKFAGVIVHCVAVDVALCQVPQLAKNSNPLTDATVLQGGQRMIMPFNELVPLDTSDSISILGNCTITGAAGSNLSYCQYELYTPRNWQPVTGSSLQ